MEVVHELGSTIKADRASKVGDSLSSGDPVVVATDSRLERLTSSSIDDETFEKLQSMS